MNKTFMSVLVSGVLIVLLSAPVLAQGGVPHQFYGSVTTNGNPAPDGLLIVARIQGEDVAGTVTAGGSYGIEPPGSIFYVLDPDDDRNGETIEFFVAGIKGGEWTFRNGNSTELDLSVTGQFCGDSICSGSETCSSCSRDCGTCTSPGGSGPGGGGSPPETPVNETQGCVENWVCSDWLDCFNGRQRRVCVDASNCGTSFDRPPEILNCEIEIPEALGNETPSTGPSADGQRAGDGITGFLTANGTFFAGAIALIIILVLLSLFAATRKKKKK